MIASVKNGKARAATEEKTLEELLEDVNALYTIWLNLNVRLGKVTAPVVAAMKAAEKEIGLEIDEEEIEEEIEGLACSELVLEKLLKDLLDTKSNLELNVKRLIAEKAAKLEKFKQSLPQPKEWSICNRQRKVCKLVKSLGATRYMNPWPTYRPFCSWRKLVSMTAWKFRALGAWCYRLCTKPFTGTLPNEEQLKINLPIVPKEEIVAEISDQGITKDQVKATWLGHASVLLQFENVNILCDPVFSNTVGPSSGCFQKFGFERYISAPLQVDDLPEIHAVVISHDHHDHADEASIRELSSRFPTMKWFVPKGLKKWMEKTIAKPVKKQTQTSDNPVSFDANNPVSSDANNPVSSDANNPVSSDAENVVELNWWENSIFVGPSQEQINFTFTPTQHWSGRTWKEMYTVLWGSWVISSKNLKVWFGGDTGYCKVFKEIGELFGSFDLAAIPIGAYLPRNVMKDQHIEPRDSIRIHKDINANKSFGIHWNTFQTGAVEGHMDPKTELEICLEAAGVSRQEFVTLKHGESITVNAN